MSETDIVDVALSVETADKVRLAAGGYYEWQSPLIVADTAPVVEWEDPFGDLWRTRELTLRTSQGTEIPVSAAPNRATCIAGGDRRPVERFDPVDEDPDDDGERWCEVCGYGPSSEIGVKRHHGIKHEGDPQLLSKAPNALGDAEAGDENESHGDGDQVDRDAVECEDVAVDDVDDQDAPDVVLPEGVTPNDVQQLTEELEALGDVAHELGVTRGRARTITVALECYGDVKDLPRRRGGQA